MDIGSGKNDLLMRLLSASTLRGEVLANNVANQSTPGFRREVVRFEEVLRERLANGGDVREARPEIEVDRLTPVKADGNNVNAELERNAMRENRLRYETYATILQGHFEMMRAAIHGSA